MPPPPSPAFLYSYLRNTQVSQTPREVGSNSPRCLSHSGSCPHTQGKGGILKACSTTLSEQATRGASHKSSHLQEAEDRHHRTSHRQEACRGVGVLIFSSALTCAFPPLFPRAPRLTHHCQAPGEPWGEEARSESPCPEQAQGPTRNGAWQHTVLSHGARTGAVRWWLIWPCIRVS